MLRYEHRNSRNLKQTTKMVALQLPTLAEQETGLLLNECHVSFPCSLLPFLSPLLLLSYPPLSPLLLLSYPPLSPLLLLSYPPLSLLLPPFFCLIILSFTPITPWFNHSIMLYISVNSCRLILSTRLWGSVSLIQCKSPPAQRTAASLGRSPWKERYTEAECFTK